MRVKSLEFVQLSLERAKNVISANIVDDFNKLREYKLSTQSDAALLSIVCTNIHRDI